MSPIKEYQNRKAAQLGKIRLGIKKKNDAGFLSSATDYSSVRRGKEVFGEKPRTASHVPTEDATQWRVSI